MVIIEKLITKSKKCIKLLSDGSCYKAYCHDYSIKTSNERTNILKV